MLKSFLKKFNNSKYQHLSLSEKKQFLILNRINVFFALLMFSAGLYLYFIAVPQSKYVLLSSSILLSFIFLLSFYLSHHSRYKTSSYITIISLMIIMTLMGILFGKNAKVEYYFLFSAALSIVLISDKKTVFIFQIFNLISLLILIRSYEEFTPLLERKNPPLIVDFLNPVIVFVLITYLIRNFKNENVKNETELQKRNEIIQKQSDELKTVDELKSKLYTDISHEIKTPLTLISVPVQELFANENDTEKKEIYELVIKNTHRLLQLTNQILMLSKYDSGNLQLKSEEFDIVELIGICVSDFEYTAKKRNISFCLQSPYKKLMIKADREQVQTILNNLLSNAFKFTDEYGAVTLGITSINGSVAEIRVSDTGKGISEDDLPKIFDRYYKIENTTYDRLRGTGIGLELAKRLTELHNGSIEVISDKGKGSSFIVKLPNIISGIRSETFENSGTSTNVLREQEGHLCLSKTLIKEEELQEDEKSLILIAEDHDDTLHYLKGILLKNYSVIDAKDGKSAYMKALKCIPDIILSDVMMPGTDGIEFCKKVRSDPKLSHIPIILLTAKHFEKDRLIGFESGADHYLEKPFNIEELKLIISNLLERRDQIAELYSKKIFFPGRDIVLESETDRFLKKLTSIIEKNIDNPGFSLSDLCKEVGYSRSQLFRKTKAITKTSPNEFIRNIRLKQAAILLKNKTGNISEICYSVGFKKPSYFAECFKTLFGCTPSEYLSA